MRTTPLPRRSFQLLASTSKWRQYSETRNESSFKSGIQVLNFRLFLGVILLVLFTEVFTLFFSSWTGEIPYHHNGILSRGNGIYSHVWYHQRRVFPGSTGLVRRLFGCIFVLQGCLCVYCTVMFGRHALANLGHTFENVMMQMWKNWFDDETWYFSRK